MFQLPEFKPEEILIYLRKSRTDEPALTVQEVVAKHEQMLDDWCMRNIGELVPEHNRFREVLSGETIESRPEVQKVLRLIEQDKYKALLIVEPQRLSRGDLEDIGRLTKILRYTHTLVITLQYTYDIADERDRDYFERELKRGNDYLEYSKRIMQNGLRLCIQKGYYMGSQAPYGYKLHSFRENKRVVHTLEIVPEEAEGVKLAFNMYANGNGAAKICHALNVAGIKPRKADRWRPPVIYVMLSNPHYIGLVRYDSRKSQKIVVDGEIKSRRCRSENPELYPGRHEAIIPQELWDKVQSMRKVRHLPPVRNHLDIQNPLAGLVYCECGGVMVKAASTANRMTRIHCKNQGYCHNAGCTIEYIIDVIRNTLEKELHGLQLDKVDDSESSAEIAKVKMIESHIAELSKKRDALWEKYSEGMPKDVFDRLIAKNEEEIQSCSETLETLKKELSSIENVQQSQVALQDALSALISANPKLINKALKSCIYKITYSRQRAYKDEAGKMIKPEPVISIELLI